MGEFRVPLPPAERRQSDRRRIQCRLTQAGTTERGDMEIGHLATLAAVCVVAYFVGEGFARGHVPRLPVYLAVGALASVVIPSVNETADLAYPVISPMALCWVSVVGRSELVAVLSRVRSTGSTTARVR